MQKHDKITTHINLIKLPANQKIEFELDKETEWVKNILVEMNENASEKKPEDYLAETNLVVFGDMEKKNKNDLGEYLVVRGTIEADYVTECVRTLQPMTIQLDIPFKIAFFDESMAKTEAFEGIDETFVENDVYEIYFYDKRTVDFEAMIHEQIFLNYNQYPVLDADSKLTGVDSVGE